MADFLVGGKLFEKSCSRKKINGKRMFKDEKALKVEEEIFHGFCKNFMVFEN